MKDDLQRSVCTDVSASGQTNDDQARTIFALRLLATTDVHMQLLGYDYVTDQPLKHHGLAGLATLIKDARKEASARGMACMLFDNGDLLQGTTLGATCADQPVTAGHPLVRCLNAMSYDAIGLGNHDLDHGLDYLLGLATRTTCPVIASNLRLPEPCALTTSALLQPVPPEAHGAESGGPQVGIVSLLPDQTSQWNSQTLKDRAVVLPARDTLALAAQNLRNQGADIVVVLAHMGVDSILHNEGAPDDALSLAAVPGVDAIIAGHTHRRLPGRDHAGMENVDGVTGALANRPAVMPGHDASDLAVLDLTLARTATDPWHVSAYHSQLRPNTAASPADPVIAEILTAPHVATRHRLARQLGQVNSTLHNFFSLAMPTNTCALLAQAKARIVQDALTQSKEAALPLLAAASAHTAGGRSGPGNFLHIPKGPLLERHLAGLNPFENEICGLRTTGADLRAWLEHGMGIYNQLNGGDDGQLLLRQDRPTFEFDTIFGLDYGVDPTRPEGARLTYLTHDRTPVTDTQEFILATTMFRAHGGGGGARFPQTSIVCHSKTPFAPVLQQILAADDIAAKLSARPWRFDVPTTIKAVVRTTPDALEQLTDARHLNPVYVGTDDDGFARLRLTL